jgi:hypothetical protein
MKLLRLLSILILLFAVSVYFRSPYIENEVSPNNEAAVKMMTVLENWKARGVSNYHFTPVLTWQKDGDKHISNYKRLEDKQGNNYYISFPPFSFLFLYGISFCLNIEPSQTFVQIVNLMLHLISAFFIYLIICSITKKHFLELPFPALIGFTVYSYTPVLLYVHTFCFFPEIMGQFFFIIGVYLYLLIKENPISANWKKLLLFGFIIFLMIYSEWLGIFFALTLLGLHIKKYKKDPFARSLVNTVFISSFLSLSLIFIQYISINGLSTLAKSMSLRFLERSGFFGEHYSDMGISYNNLSSYVLLLRQFHLTMIGFGYVFLLFIMVWAIRSKFSIKNNSVDKSIIIILLVPLMAEFVVFFNATLIHSVWWARFGIIISIGIALLANKFVLNEFPNKKKMILKSAVWLILAGSAAFSVYSFRGHAVTISMQNQELKYIGSILKQHSGDDEAVFVRLPDELKKYNTYLSFIAKRNIMNVNSVEDAEKFLKEKNKARGVFYTFGPGNKPSSIVHFEIK